MDVQTRHCVGSARYGIEAHDAPLTDFPAQPSGKDGLGRMCRDHWSRYTSALRQDQLARSGAPAATTAPDDLVTEGTPKTLRPARATKPSQAAVTARPVPEPVRRARSLVEAADALGGKAYIDAIGSDEVQAALGVSAAASVGRTVDPAPQHVEEDETAVA